MQRYYFNIYNDADALDEMGSEHADLAAAKAEAIRGARAMIAEHIVNARPVHLHHRIEIVGEDGRVLAVIPFGELITISD